MLGRELMQNVPMPSVVVAVATFVGCSGVEGAKTTEDGGTIALASDAGEDSLPIQP